MKRKSPSVYFVAHTCKKFLLLLFALCCLGSLTAIAQQKQVTGNVKDANGLPLQGVTVSAKGGAVLASTDSLGNFKANVQAPTTILVFSSIGFSIKEELVGNKSTINTVLENNAATQDEVVVVGYGTQRKRDVTGAIASVNSSQIMERQPLNVFDALQGQAAGVQIGQESGRPGASSSIRIRGTGTLEGGADPLYIVDGAQGVNIDGINPADIESIEVLKDAASAAIYGARSANGVIIITTKKGKDGKPKIDVRYLNGYGQLSRKVPQANAAERRLLDLKRGGSGAIPTDSLNPSYNADIDHQDLLTQLAIRHQVDAGVSGGNKNLNYYASFGILKDKGLIINSFADILRARINMDYKPNDKFAFGTRLQASFQTENRINEGNTLGQAIQRVPNFRIYFPDGTLAPVIGGRRNPVAEALMAKNNYDIYNMSLYNYMSYNISKDLKFTVDANVRVNYQKNLRFNGKILSTATPPNNDLFEFTELNTYWITQAFFNYNKTFKKNHTVNGVLGVSADNEFEQITEQGGLNLVTENVLTLNSVQERSLGSTFQQRIFTNSAFARFGYSYKGRYLFNSNFRADASSRFGEQNRWGFFPSASVGWRFTDENFMGWTRKILTDGKLRVSYGITGNDRVGAYESQQRYTFSGGTSGNTYNGVSGVATASLFGNDRLRWEQQIQTNIGADLNFFNGKLNVTLDYYDKVTSDLLYSAPLPYESGFTSIKVNAGSIRNRGFELLLSGTPIRKKNWSWNSSFNISFNNNTVIDLFGGTTLFPGNPSVWLVRKGGRLGDFFGYKALGVYAYDESNAYNTNWDLLTPIFNSGTFTGYEFDGKPYTGTVNRMFSQGQLLRGGDMIWDNITKDSTIDDNDRVVLGNAQPDFTASFINSFTYKGFSLSFNFYVSWGGTIYNRARVQLNQNTSTNVTPEPDYIRGSWWRPGDVTIYPVARNNGAGNAREGSSLYMEDASFIRLRNMRIGYELPRKLVSKLKLSNVSIYAYGNNLLTWTRYKWYDPEISFGSVLTPGLDNGRYPRRREFGGGININF